jgi:hypothetical protein
MDDLEQIDINIKNKIIGWALKQGKQIDFVIDYRNHPSQKVLRPSFQTLQQEAICSKAGLLLG